MKTTPYIAILYLAVFLEMPQKGLSQSSEFKDSTMIESIIQEHTGYYSANITKTRLELFFNEYGKIDCKNYFDNSNNQETTRYLYDSSKKKVIQETSFGSLYKRMYLQDTIINKFIYNKEDLLSATIATNNKDSLLWIESYQYDEKKHQTQSKFFKTPEYILRIMPEYSKDSTYYDYENNKLFSYTLATNGAVLMSLEAAIYPLLITGNVYNEMGYFIENETHKVLYEYDKHGNWTSQKSYEKTNTGNKLNFEMKRQIKYRDE